MMSFKLVLKKFEMFNLIMHNTKQLIIEEDLGVRVARPFQVNKCHYEIENWN